jgi:2',3'-cyclic-nucleotide 2'-phosphodiesterase (5'-nucleotidase family)
VRASIAAGNVTQGGVITVLPFGNVVSVVRVNGSALVQAIQSGLQGFPGQGRFAQVRL